MSKPFRVATITLDEDEEVTSVTAIVSTRALGVARELLDRDLPWTVLSETESQVELTVADIWNLFGACGKLTGLDPRHDVTHVIYDSLAGIIFPLIDTD